MEEGILRQVGPLQELYLDARSTKHKNLRPRHHDDGIRELRQFLDVDERYIPPNAGLLSIQPPDEAARPRIRVFC
jgi:hypothetical protein